LALCEGLLRLFWCGPARETYEYQSAPFLTDNPYWGIWHFANHSVEHRKSCFAARYRTNEFGMKSDPVGAGKPRIALLGDSFVEGFGNDNETTIDRYMRDLLEHRYEVLNFGVSGKFSTIDELVLYDGFARFFEPRIAVLFFLNYNDLRDNLLPAKRRYIDERSNLLYPRPERFEAVVEAIRREAPPQSAAAEAERRFCLSRLLRAAERVLNDQLQMRFDILWDIHAELAAPYLAEDDPELTRAWAIIDASLGRLAEITARQGTALVVAHVADPYQIDKNWLRLLSAWVGKPLDPELPNRRLREICERRGIRYYDMLEETMAYIAERALHFPYLSFRCDRHYAPEGQRVMATLAVDYLRREGLVGP
ncbi:MAG: hypothetical protein ACREQQ_11960, partial [Candidatus Binatia bacterium]